MKMNTSLVCLIALLSILTIYEARCTQISKESLVLDKKYKLLKKPSIKTIKTEYGDIYDCIDFYKQPAFDHPLLKNHTFHPEMRPSFVPESTSISPERMFYNNMKLNDGGCPKGTVPIKRMSKDDFNKSMQFTEDYALRIRSNDIKRVPGDHYAILETNTGPGMTYKGGGGTFSTHGGLPIKPSQYSSAGLIIRNGDDLIQVGWTINPAINNDYRTHFFQYFSAGTSHCFNTQCPGFVLTRESPIDHALKHVSKLRGKLWVMTILVYKDPKDGNWWLAIDHEHNQRELVGFWPQQIFTSLANSASYVAVGGEAYGPYSERLPAMGNGYYPKKDIEISAFCSNIWVMDGDSIIIDDPKQTKTFCDNSHYGVHDIGKSKFYYDMGRMIFFGGTSIIGV